MYLVVIWQALIKTQNRFQTHFWECSEFIFSWKKKYDGAKGAEKEFCCFFWKMTFISFFFGNLKIHRLWSKRTKQDFAWGTERLIYCHWCSCSKKLTTRGRLSADAWRSDTHIPGSHQLDCLFCRSHLHHRREVNAHPFKYLAEWNCHPDWFQICPFCHLYTNTFTSVVFLPNAVYILRTCSDGLVV